MILILLPVPIVPSAISIDHNAHTIMHSIQPFAFIHISIIIQSQLLQLPSPTKNLLLIMPFKPRQPINQIQYGLWIIFFIEYFQQLILKQIKSWKPLRAWILRYLTGSTKRLKLFEFLSHLKVKFKDLVINPWIVTIQHLLGLIVLPWTIGQYLIYKVSIFL